MLLEGEEKNSRGWIYIELEFNIPSESIENKVEDEVLEGEQISMFE
jgi:hypothetical protein